MKVPITLYTHQWCMLLNLVASCDSFKPKGCKSDWAEDFKLIAKEISKQHNEYIDGQKKRNQPDTKDC